MIFLPQSTLSTHKVHKADSPPILALNKYKCIGKLNKIGRQSTPTTEMNFMILFIDWIIVSYLHTWGTLIFDTFKSIWIILLCQIVMLITLSLVLRKLKFGNKKRVLLYLISIFLLMFFVNGPFLIIQDERNMIDLGVKIVSQMNKLKNERSEIPKTIEEIELMFSDVNQRNEIRNHFSYKFIDHIIYNQKMIRESDYLKEDDYELTFRAWYLWNNHYRYNEKMNQFELTDK